MLKCELHYAG